MNLSLTQHLWNMNLTPLATKRSISLPLGTKSTHIEEPEILPWYRPLASILATDVVAAWKPIRAASYAASFANISNPGTLDAIDVGTSGWSADKGWEGNGSAYVRTMIQMGYNWSSIHFLQSTAWTGVPGLGTLDGSPYKGHYFRCGVTSSAWYHTNPAQSLLVATPSPVVLALSGSGGPGIPAKAYKDGIYILDIIPWTSGSLVNRFNLTALNYNGTPVVKFGAGQYYCAGAVYNRPLTTLEHLAIATAAILL